MKKNIVVAGILLVAIACNNTKEVKKEMVANTIENPLLVKSKLAYGAPDFSKIKNEHFMPAILEGMKFQNEKITQIIENKDQPTFENTILALEESSKTLDNVQSVFSVIASAHTNDTIKANQKELAPKLSKHSDNIYLNTALFKKVKEVYEQLATLQLDKESAHLVKEYYKKFVKAGANLAENQKEALKEINSQLASLSNDFGKKLLEASKKGGIKVLSKEALKGISEEKIAALKKEDAYEIQLINTTQQPILQSLENRTLRKQLFEKSIHRTDTGVYDTRELVKKMVLLRAKKAQILGFDNYAAWSLQGTMATTPEKVFEMLKNLIPGSLNKVASEVKEIQEEIHKNGKNFKLTPYDWNHYAEKVRKSKYNLNEEEVKPYFEVTTVLEKGVFYAANKLYGITFKKRTDIPTYHPDVMVYELFEENGDQLGLFYGDFFARDSKRGGAWMDALVKQSKLRKQKPVIYNVCNSSKPAKGAPALISFDEVATMFHEFGHALHGLFGNQKYASISGTSTARDFVEFPSQFNENWATHPEVLHNYALHYKTGEVIPDSLLKKIKEAGTFNQGYAIIENLCSSNLDMQWHTVSVATKITDIDKFEETALQKMNLKINEVPPRYRSTYFAHIFSGGYAAGYYSYLWTEMLSHDAYDWFKNNGLLTRKNGQKFREEILSKGNTMDYAEMYKIFAGRNPQTTPMLKARGLQ
ncbi:M3 family metallopeptidase [Tenacibaculum maritimum]|uniref:M3 family metallopeptidase n=1 Tax=Tenacibaculum maritimum TaxID=107401 RepID=UPI000420A66F|nr:M3 family metallopeptidase [Tenacibaculum maritimum]QCD62668.1 dipeptidyl carboxypeptidase II [Tenacibaculum maritimum]CAA0143657.1 Peptidyl-dipeptidase precursor Dcp2 [Tenacibaculum maritimum]CAA0143969.1 Peptidyl-dipeptidase precursor Dcp2 [Tenacibaculum maritimum]CAA0144535.1 Peptidyl-dipeptidase precursor Dcp2 [Tenacibaculum maritimum]CAA0145224.1 Peptidyl-dipeptidase precursor Dcp2 [Tenacibaculum maritimum]